MENNKTNALTLEDLPTKSYCVLPWTATAIGSGGEVVPCCRWFSQQSYLPKSPPNIANGLTNARNSEFWQTIRQQMIDGEHPKGCKRCWDEEGKDIHNRAMHRANQQQRFSEDSPYGRITEITNKPAKLRHLETGISRLCNFACVMCNEHDSSIIHSVIHPGKKIPKGFHKDNENIDDDLSELQLLKLVGGEPMIEAKHDELLEKIIELNNNPGNLEIQYHTNASVFPSDRVINCWKKLKKVELVLSIDGIGKLATLQRPGNYKWQDIEDTVDKYIQLTSKVNIIFSTNVVLTALNIGQIKNICEWLYNKVEKHTTMNFAFLQPIDKLPYSTYIDFRNLSKETKERIKKEWAGWEVTNPPVLNTVLRDLLITAKGFIDEKGILNKPLTKELMLEKHPNAKLWKHFNEDLKELEI
jgi:molybdenum cofactor biosynthesis enzyme MoaA|tara:strand:- start:417 stop:1658 length:1242 start_codon:yes stop_codon:yes gene_type:complete